MWTLHAYLCPAGHIELGVNGKVDIIHISAVYTWIRFVHVNDVQFYLAIFLSLSVCTLKKPQLQIMSVCKCGCPAVVGEVPL